MEVREERSPTACEPAIVGRVCDGLLLLEPHMLMSSDEHVALAWRLDETL
jgi:hypothetical protein